MVYTEDKIKSALELINNSKEIVIISHKSPDGDSIGSSIALYYYLKAKKANVTMCHPDNAPNFLNWMTGTDDILTLESDEDHVNEKMAKADLIFLLDFNTSGRIGKLDTILEETTAKRIMIDHHREPNLNFADLIFSDIQSCSTAQLIYEFIEASNDLDLLDRNIAQAIYTGIITDTGSFRFSSVQPKTHRIAASLLDLNIDHSTIHESLFDSNSENRIRLVSYTMLEKLVINRDLHTAYISLNKAELERFTAEKGDTEGLVNQALSIEGIKMAVFFKESDGIIKISFRSIGKIPVNEMAKNNFGGGGHLNAAGGKFVGKLTDAIDSFVTILPKFVNNNKSTFE
ncbi:DHH family phosphoesterase [Crocinitomix catalasitica]|uniref:DHH family phosphoesterase n=1 Tax=Crocinitomix catalasitica TaxID=184607 RepID=UPI000569AEDA|nr:bifunctional oligoribonuclease/PAP phosphatase NrnA [Crocinitomix catalasitica]